MSTAEQLGMAGMAMVIKVSLPESQVLAGKYRHEDATQAEDGQGEVEGGPLAQAAVHSQFAAMRPHQLTGDMQSQAQPPGVGIGAIGNPVKALEDALHVRREGCPVRHPARPPAGSRVRRR